MILLTLAEKKKETKRWMQSQIKAEKKAPDEMNFILIVHLNFVYHKYVLSATEMARRIYFNALYQ